MRLVFCNTGKLLLYDVNLNLRKLIVTDMAAELVFTSRKQNPIPP
jgi:hypothetical protein